MKISIPKRYFRNWQFLALLFILGVATYIRFQHAFFPGMWVDEGRYARIGTEIASHIWNYGVAEEWHGQITRFPPLYPYLIAISTWILGSNEFAVRVVSPAVSLGGVLATYFLGREMKSRDAGLIAAALLAVNPIFWFLSERILVGATFATVYTAAMLALYYGLEDREYSRYALWSLGPLVALNILTKQPAYTLGLVIPLYFLYRKRDELKQLLFEEVSFTESRFFQTLKDRDYYISGGLGLLVMMPWMLRSMAVCGFPLCGLSRAARFASVSSTPAWANTGGPFHFIYSLPTVLTGGAFPYIGLAATGLIVLRAIQYAVEDLERDADMLVKKSALTVFLLAAAYLLTPGLVPMVLLTSVALFASSDAEKLLWLWIGIGIGFMSIPSIKVPRYIVFTIPALLSVITFTLLDLADWVSENIDIPRLTSTRIAVLAAIPLVFASFTAGTANISQGGFAYLEPAGNWLDQRLEPGESVVASSPAVLRYYIHPNMAYMMPDNESRLKSFLKEKNASYVELDIYERAQPKWSQTGIPPYRLPVSTVQDIRSGKISARQVAARFGDAPDYLEPVKTFGSSKNPLTGQKQPVVIIYRVDLK